ncbi:MAG: DUF1801 domain-containing protein [Anaerolineales bacterium]
MDRYTNVDEYIALFPPEVQLKLNRLRSLIKELIPEAREVLSYRIPTYDLNGHVVHFAAYAHHIGFYPTPSGITQFKTELSPYKTSKGAVQFPLDEDLPLDLIRRIVAFRAQENRSKRQH